MGRRASLIWSVLALAMAGCNAKTVQLQNSFDPIAAGYINTKGKASITGQAFLRRNDGVVVYAAGSTVILTPVTAYAEERRTAIFGASKIRLLEGGAVKFEVEDPNYKNFQRVIKANGEGRFTFNDVAPGAYFITTMVHWCVPQRYGCDPQGGALFERINIAGAERADLILNGE